MMNRGRLKNGSLYGVLASVIIPSFGRPSTLARCVDALAKQSLPSDEFEVLVGLDGLDAESERAARDAWTRDADRLTIDAAPHAGQANVRNRLIARAKGRVLVFLNDDVAPSEDLVRAHATDPAHGLSNPRPAIVLGATPWKVFEPDTLFRQLVRETSMVFFYHRMDERLSAATSDEERAQLREHDWGFRHAWLLNLSVRADLVRAARGLSVFPSTYGFEDDELAWRLREKFGARVLYRPEAVGTHEHRLTPAEYLSREYKLGYAAWGFATTVPVCARELFGRDITSSGEVEYAREFVERERRGVEHIRTKFEELDGLAPLQEGGAGGGSRSATDSGDGPGRAEGDERGAGRLERGLCVLPLDSTASHANTGCDPRRWLLDTLYQMHLPLKRWWWRRGLLDAAEGREMRADSREVSAAGA